MTASVRPHRSPRRLILSSEPELLEGLVRPLFTALWVGWELDDFTPLRPWLSDAVHEGLRVERRLLALQGLRRFVSKVRLDGLEVASRRRGRVHDSVHVKVRWARHDVELSDATTQLDGHQVALHSRPEHFEDIWAFARADDAPDGAWVLTGMMPLATYRFPERIPGLSMLERDDPRVSGEAIADRAQLLFWKWLEALAIGSSAPLVKVARPAFLADWAAQQSRRSAEEVRRSVQDCTLEEVTVKRIRHLDGRDRAEVLVGWSSAMGDLFGGEALRTLPRHRQERLFLLSRSVEARTLSAVGLASHRCAACGQAPGEGPLPVCDACGVALSPGEQDWAL